MSVTLRHAQFPAKRSRIWIKRSEHSTVAAAVRAVHDHYRGKHGWWYQIYMEEREVYSSDHELAGLLVPLTWWERLHLALSRRSVSQ